MDLPQVRQIVGCPPPSGGPPPARTRSGPGPIVPTDGAVHAQMCPAISGLSRAPDEIARVLNTGMDALVTAVNALPAADPDTGCPDQGGPAFDLVITYRDGSGQVLVQVDTADCGLVHHDGQFRHGGAALYQTIVSLLHKQSA